jgi:putative ABC transport system permease protein
MKASLKDILREVWKTRTRFISIALLLMLSVGFFSGLRATKPDMRLTADAYMDEHAMYDIRVQSTLGMTREDVDAIAKLDGVKAASGSYSFDALAAAPDEDIVISIHTLSDSGMNTPSLISGRLPERNDECVTEERFLQIMALGLGDSFTIKELPKNFEDALRVRTLTIVGTVCTPLYLSKAQRGNASLGRGSVSGYIMVNSGAVDLDYFTEVDVTVRDAEDKTAYTDAYADAVRPVTEGI